MLDGFVRNIIKSMTGLMTKHYFTFGFGQVHENGFHVIMAEDKGKARKKMFEKFGNKWAFQYDEKSWFNKDGVSQQEEFGLRQIK